MTSDKSGPVRTATPALEEDLDDTRVRKDVTGKQAPAATPDTKQAGASSGQEFCVDHAGDVRRRRVGKRRGPEGRSAGGAHHGAAPTPAAKPATPAPKPAASSAKPAAARPGAARPGAEPPVPPAPSDSGSAVPTTGGVWRSAYEAGRSGKDAPQAGPDTDEATAPPGLVSAIGRVSAKTDAPTSPRRRAGTWRDREVVEPGLGARRVPAGLPAADSAGAEGVRAGAMKAAQAALDAARSAAKKVSSIMPDDEERTAPTQSAARTRPEMHYTAGGVRGTATPVGAPAAGAPGQPGQQSQARPASSPTPEVPRPAPAGPRRVRLAISRVDPWSVMKLAFLLAVAIAIMTVVATAVFWSVLNSFGVFTTVQEFVRGRRRAAEQREPHAVRGVPPRHLPRDADQHLQHRPADGDRDHHGVPVQHHCSTRRRRAHDADRRLTDAFSASPRAFSCALRTTRCTSHRGPRFRFGTSSLPGVISSVA